LPMFLVWQLANTVGFFGEWTRFRRERAGNHVDRTS
jgi:hypothetical protein